MHYFYLHKPLRRLHLTHILISNFKKNTAEQVLLVYSQKLSVFSFAAEYSAYARGTQKIQDIKHILPITSILASTIRNCVSQIHH